MTMDPMGVFPSRKIIQPLHFKRPILDQSDQGPPSCLLVARTIPLDVKIQVLHLTKGMKRMDGIILQIYVK